MTTQSEIDKSIYRQDGTDVEPIDEQYDTITYTTKKNSKERLDGNAIIIDHEDEYCKLHLAEDSKFAYAKSIKFPCKTKYYIKYASGTLLNPLGLYSRDIYKKIGDESVYRWKEVNQKAFKFYIGFLKTQNEAYYRNAERSMI